jgi:hypothetical protein
MQAIVRPPLRAETIKSVSLADLEFGRPSPFDKFAGLAKMALMLWGALSFGAAAGTAAYFVAGSTEPILVSERKVEKPKDLEAPAAPERVAAIAEAEPSIKEYVDSGEPQVLNIPEPVVVEARLPRPRPDEPIITGSIERPRAARNRYATPCDALARLGARFAISIRCHREARVYAPPPPPASASQARYDYPQPYRPPTVVR